jgi:hypothetical protein
LLPGLDALAELACAAPIVARFRALLLAALALSLNLELARECDSQRTGERGQRRAPGVRRSKRLRQSIEPGTIHVGVSCFLLILNPA